VTCEAIEEIRMFGRVWSTVAVAILVEGAPARARAEEPPRPSEAELLRLAPGKAPWDRETGWFKSSTELRWTGGLETDVGYARYTFRDYRSPPDDFYDFRGRFVLGPELRYPFGANYFFRAFAQVVAWVREYPGTYQINADDVYAQVGQFGTWDFMVGRFMTWRVYRKGLGFDLYTLEDTGALRDGNYDQGNFGVRTYEVSTIFYREQPGRAAFHFYPTAWSGIELAGQYGKDNTSNTIGGRAAANVHFDFLSLSAAVEYKHVRPSTERSTQLPGNDPFDRSYCDMCGVSKQYGAGGGAVVTLKPIELGVNAARRYTKNWDNKEGQPDKSSSDHVTSIGGYLEVDVGSLAIQRSLIVGGGVNRTERLSETEDFDRHVQAAAYIGYPLGFNNAMIKVVGSYANALSEDANGNLLQGTMFAGRVRLKFDF
jgi:hypothetical protein